jgi:hypothetical protein
MMTSGSVSSTRLVQRRSRSCSLEKDITWTGGQGGGGAGAGPGRGWGARGEVGAHRAREQKGDSEEPRRRKPQRGEWAAPGGPSAQRAAAAQPRPAERSAAAARGAPWPHLGARDGSARAEREDVADERLVLPHLSHQRRDLAGRAGGSGCARRGRVWPAGLRLPPAARAPGRRCRAPRRNHVGPSARAAVTQRTPCDPPPHTHTPG